MVITQNEITEPGGEQHDGEKRKNKKSRDCMCGKKGFQMFFFPVSCLVLTY